MSSFITSRRAAFAVALAANAAIAFGAAAEPASITVDYQDLDMTQPKSVQILYRRISRAAKAVCHEPSRGSLAQIPAFRECYRTAVENAVQKINSQTLTALHRQKTQYSQPS